ncbi:MAG: hypothetical protein PHU77_00610 [Simplicispira sp.]|nr:hypothetical protein [Simplicispira sp.]
MSPRQEADIQTVKAMELALLETLKDQPHGLALTALMAAYLRVAFANPCCMHSCAQQASRAALLLLQHAEAGRPDGTHIH